MPMLKEGDVFVLAKGHKVSAQVPAHFLYFNHRGDFTPAWGQVKVDGELSYLAGRYVVTRTALAGGGTGHGPNDVYDDGHLVTAHKVDNPECEVQFYQSGSFTNLIPPEEVEVVGRAKLRWVEDPPPSTEPPHARRPRES